MFWKKEKDKDKEKLKRERIKKILEELRPKIDIEEYIPKTDLRFKTRDYSQFIKEIRREPRTFYEKLCWKAEKILRIKPDKKTKEKLESEIKTAYLDVTPEGVVSLTFLLAIIGLIFFISSIILIKDVLFSIVLLSLFLGSAWYCYTYPEKKSREIEVKMASDLVIAVLYMVIYMRTSPNIEGALKFAAENLTGPLSWDLKKLLWDMEVGVYPSLDIALEYYLAKWKDKNEEFVEALQMLRAATGETKERRLSLLDEAINVMLNGTRDKMRHYAQKLRMPVMLVYTMGIMLPVIGLVMFPIVALFMAQLVKPIFIFIGYDILLPLFLYWFISNMLKTKPATFSQPEIKEAKNVPSLGKFRFMGKELPVWPFSILAGLPFILYGVAGISSIPIETLQGIELQTLYSVYIIIGLSIIVIVYCYLDSFQKMPLRKKIERIENEFGEALFQFGNQIAGGRPLEIAMERAIRDMKNLKIADLFKEAISNIKKLGVTFEQALFDKNIGVIWNYPSRLIKSIFRVIIESMEKSVKLTALTTLTLSRYLKGVKMVKEEIMSMLSETITSMYFLASFLAPLISGIIVTMAIVIMEILFVMTEKLQSVLANATMPTALPTFLTWAWSGGGTGMPITPAGFQLVVGLYTLETAIIISYFVNRLEYGEDAIGLRNIIYKTVLIATIVYVLAWWISFRIFGPVLGQILAPF
ncbi:MAG TPA: hypothetical protein EYH56_02925 [Nanoarchaeota archaeon]|nr:hypothetical protein [Nanoarchaeota archaeon]